MEGGRGGGLCGISLHLHNAFWCVHVLWWWLMRGKNGSGTKLSNPPESEGHLAVQFIPATTAAIGSPAPPSYKTDTINVSHYTFFFSPCQWKNQFFLNCRCTVKICRLTWGIFFFIFSFSSLACLQEERARRASRRMKPNIWICSMIPAWTAISIQRRGSTTN